MNYKTFKAAAMRKAAKEDEIDRQNRKELYDLIANEQAGQEALQKISPGEWMRYGLGAAGGGGLGYLTYRLFNKNRDAKKALLYTLFGSALGAGSAHLWLKASDPYYGRSNADILRLASAYANNPDLAKRVEEKKQQQDQANPTIGDQLTKVIRYGVAPAGTGLGAAYFVGDKFFGKPWYQDVQSELAMRVDPLNKLMNANHSIDVHNSLNQNLALVQKQLRTPKLPAAERSALKEQVATLNNLKNQFDPNVPISKQTRGTFNYTPGSGFKPASRIGRWGRLGRALGIGALFGGAEYLADSLFFPEYDPAKDTKNFPATSK